MSGWLQETHDYKSVEKIRRLRSQSECMCAIYSAIILFYFHYPLSFLLQLVGDVCCDVNCCRVLVVLRALRSISGIYILIKWTLRLKKKRHSKCSHFHFLSDFRFCDARRAACCIRRMHCRRCNCGENRHLGAYTGSAKLHNYKLHFRFISSIRL